MIHSHTYHTPDFWFCLLIFFHCIITQFPVFHGHISKHAAGITVEMAVLFSQNIQTSLVEYLIFHFIFGFEHFQTIIYSFYFSSFTPLSPKHFAQLSQSSEIRGLALQISLNSFHPPPRGGVANMSFCVVTNASTLSLCMWEKEINGFYCR